MQKADLEKINGAFSVFSLQKNGRCHIDIYFICYIYRLYW